jgi:hypothetical protein
MQTNQEKVIAIRLPGVVVTVAQRKSKDFTRAR